LWENVDLGVKEYGFLWSFGNFFLNWAAHRFSIMIGGVADLGAPAQQLHQVPQGTACKKA
jgi:hypothetical protein